MHDITAQFREFARGAPGGGGGLLHVFVPHTTAGVAVIELGAGSDAWPAGRAVRLGAGCD